MSYQECLNTYLNRDVDIDAVVMFLSDSYKHDAVYTRAKELMRHTS